MKTIIDHYMNDALDELADFREGTTLPEVTGYESSRDVDEDMIEHSLTKDVAFRRRSFDPAAESAQPPQSGSVQIGTDNIEVELVQGVDEEDFRKTCAMTIAAPTGRDWREVEWEEMLRGGLQTALESQVIVFAVKGVSRACTHQLVRTRKAAYHQQSQRATYYGNRPETRLAESMWNNPRARAAALRAIYFSHRAYEVACEENISYQDARLVLLEGTTNWIMCEYPLRTFIETYAYRGCSMFQWEIVSAFRQMRALLVEAHPWLDPYIKISCEKTSGAIDPNPNDHELREDAHSCTYQGHEFVEGQCDFPWARESNRTFTPNDAHRIGPKS